MHASAKKSITFKKISLQLITKLCLLSIATLPLTPLAMAQETTITTTLSTIDNILINPDIGITEHHSFNIKNDPWWNQPTHPETSVVYFRWYWEELEPQKGQYNFKLIDDTINQAAALGKTTVFRFMTMAGVDEVYYDNSPNAGKKILGIPCWLKQKIDPNTIGETCADDNSYTVDYKNPIFKKNLKRFLKAMGERYNNNPNILRLDVGLVGTWGEWNLASHKGYDRPTLGYHGYTDADLLPFPKMMKEAFPNKTLVMYLGSNDENILSHSTQRNYGWRADCIGDWELGWNHMEHGYPSTFEHAQGLGNNHNSYPDPQFLQRWKEAPVDFEICYTVDEWAAKKDIYTVEKVKQTFDTALDMHTSLLNLKSGNIPEIYQPLLDDFLKKVGYRFELNTVEVTSNFKAGSPFLISSSWKNTGVAPSYNNYPVVWRLRDRNDKIITYFETHNDIRHWLPADNKEDISPQYTQKNSFTLPDNITDDHYYLDVALVKPNTQQAAIKLGVEGVRKDKWHQVKSIYLMNNY